jgi:hypothetical protein
MPGMWDLCTMQEFFGIHQWQIFFNYLKPIFLIILILLEMLRTVSIHMLWYLLEIMVI